MVNTGLLLRLEAKHGKDAELERFLTSAVPAIREEAGTIAWFGLRFGRGECGIFDAFPSDDDRNAHMTGAVAARLRAEGPEMLGARAVVRKLTILASKLPAEPSAEITKGLLLTFHAKSGHEAEVEEFLRGAKAIVDAEPGTVAWFAIRFDDDGTYGIFDVFPDHGARFAHLTGHVPRELAKHALTILGSVPDMHLPEVIASTMRGVS